MAEEFRRYLNQFRCDKGQSYTHTSIGNPKISLHVPEEKAAEFHAEYTRAMVKGYPLHLTEKPTDPSPMRVDLDFRSMMGETKELTRSYTADDIMRILRMYFEVLSSFIDAPEDAWVAYVMEKPSPVEYRGKIKDGLHIVYPHLSIAHTMQHLVRKKILDVANALFVGMPLCNTYEDIVDQAIIDKNNWQMYGSRKIDSDAYRVTKVFKYHCDTCVIEELPVPSAEEELRFVSLFSMRHKASSQVRVKGDKEAELDEYVRLVLPTMDERKKTKLHNQVFGKSLNHTKNYVSEEELTLARQLVTECLNPRRAESYEDWIKVGWALRNIDYRLLDAWVEFSRCSSKYLEGECQTFWGKMRIDTLGMGTLRWWARHDNPMKYNEIMDSNVMTLVDRCVGSEGAHFDVARVVHAMYKDRYRFTTQDIWYTYREQKHRWVRTKEGLQLRIVLSNEVCSKFMDRSMHWSTEAMRAVPETRVVYEERSKKLAQIALRLKQSGYKDSVMKECKCLFTDEHFEQLLDSHPHLLCFENGVYDLRMHEFRDGLPDDYVSFCTGRYYIPYDATSPEATEIEGFLSSVFTNDQVRRYMKDVMACAVDGGIRQEKFYILTGSGCHAKDTEIMMADGSLKLVQDIVVGDQLMGDDSTPRNVKELFRGQDTMMRIIPKKGEPFVVNQHHKLTLKVTKSSMPNIVPRKDKFEARWLEKIFSTTEDGCIVQQKTCRFSNRKEAEAFIKSLIYVPNVLQEEDKIDVQVKNYVNWNMDRYHLYLYRTGVEYAPREVTLDPYFLGYWLGDGTSCEPGFTTAESEVVEYIEQILPSEHKMTIYDKKGGAIRYGISFKGKRVGRYTCQNEILNNMRKYNIIGNKHIPIDFLQNTREVRLQVLAGIMDSDGYATKSNSYEITLKNEKLLDEVIQLARSLGFNCYKNVVQKKCYNNGKVNTYYQTFIHGNDLDDIPCLVPRKNVAKRQSCRDPMAIGFKVQPIGVGDYYGFCVDKNHRYLMSDFVVTANSNGKSKIFELIQKAVGDYFCIMPIALLTQKRAASNSAQSELERTRGRRVAIMQEPGENEKLNIGLMKELSGGDRIICRGLFKEPVEFKPQFKMFMTCNDLPEVPSDDGGTWRRIRVIEFTSKFVENPTKPKEFPMDPELTDKFDRWADMFISMILEHHKHMDPKAIHEPVEVRIATEGYKKNNDIIGQYIGEKMVRDEESTEKLLLNKLFNDFKVWAYQAVQKGKKIPDRNQFRAYMEKEFGVYPADGKGWRGIRYLVSDHEDEPNAE